MRASKCKASNDSIEEEIEIEKILDKKEQNGKVIK